MPKPRRVAISALLEVAQVAVRVAPPGREGEDRIADELSRPVVGHVAAATGLVELDAPRRAAPRPAMTTCVGSALRPSVITGGCSSSSSVSRLVAAPHAPSTRRSCSAARLGVAGRGRAQRDERASRPQSSDSSNSSQARLDHREELVGDGAVDHAVVVGHRQVHHRADRDGVVDHHRALLDPADAEDRDLRLVDDRQAEQAAEDPGFVIVNVPPWTSSGLSFFARARSARSLIRLEQPGDRQLVGVLARPGRSGPSRARPRRRCSGPSCRRSRRLRPRS